MCAAQPDKQFFDLFTQMDNILARLNEQLIANNQLQQRTNFLLQELLVKPTTIDAPQLRDITIESLTRSSATPNNLEIIPQLLWDWNAKKFYILRNSFIIAGWHDLDKEDTSTDEFPVKDRIGGADLLWLKGFKTAGYHMNHPTFNTPEDVSIEFFINDKRVVNVFAQENILVPYLNDPNDQSFYAREDSKFKTVLTNGSKVIVVRIYLELTFFLYKEISFDYALTILDQIKELVS